MVSKNLFALTLAVLIFFIGLLVLTTYFYSKTSNQRNENEGRISSLLHSNNTRILGRACGVLSKSTAKRFLQTDNIKLQDYISGVQLGGDYSTANLSGSIDGDFSWQDSCGYEVINNSLDYVQLTMQTFETTNGAQQAFSEILPKVNNVETLDPQGYGDKLLYDAGVHYLLRNREIITVSANNSSKPGNSELSQTVFEQVLMDL